MSITKTVLALGLVAFIAACAQQEEPQPVIVTPDPVYTKY